ncbi:hypothetical protein, partial [Tsukamurella tyrosinosolvens]
MFRVRRAAAEEERFTNEGMAEAMARDDNRGPLSRLRDLRGRLASWPAAPLHDHHPETAGSLGSAP